LSAAADSGALGSRSGFYIAASACSGIAITCALAGALLSAAAVAGDFAHGVARTALTRPLPRQAWMAGRVAALCASAVLIWTCAASGALAVGAFRFGLTAASEGSYEIASARFLAEQWLSAGALSLGALFCAIGWGALVGCAAGQTGSAVTGVALSGAALAALSRWSRAEPFVPLSYLSPPHERLAALAQGIAGAHASDGWPKALGVLLFWLVGTAVLAGWVLRRKDILT
jgi:hypothetical protein